MPNDLSNVHKIPWSFLYLFSIRLFKFRKMEYKLEMFESFTFNSHISPFLDEFLILLFFMKFEACICFGFSLACPRVDCEPKVKVINTLFHEKNKGHCYYKAPSWGVLWTYTSSKFLIQFLVGFRKKNKLKN